MKNELKNKVRENNLSAESLVVAVSGGVDSVVLLDILASILPKKDLVVAHVNHGLRAESDQEAEFVERLAKDYDLQYELGELKLKDKSEATARKARYRFLRQVKEKHEARYIVTAHHADDQLETVILKLVRGASPVELFGMKEFSSDVWRPLLSFSKEEIHDYAKAHKLGYVEDSTNNELDYTRNKIRHQVLPVLKEINPQVLKVVERNSLLAIELADYIDSSLIDFKGSSIAVEKVEYLPIFLKKELIRRKLKEMLGRKTDVYAQNVEAVLSLLGKTGTKKTEIGGKEVVFDGQKLVFDPQEVFEVDSLSLELGKWQQFGEHKIRVSRTGGKAGKNNILLPGSFSDKLSIRKRQKGDKIKTKSGTKKLQDLFTDAKIPKNSRGSWPIVVCGSEIVWVPQLAACDKALPEAKNNNLKIEVK